MINYDLQIQQSECGLACVAAILRYHGSKITLSGLRKQFHISARGSQLKEIKEICTQVGLSSRALKVGSDEVHQLKTPCVLHWGFNHFVVLEKATKNSVTVFDPAVGHRKLKYSEFLDEFTGVALEVEQLKKFENKIPEPSLKLKSLVTTNKNFWNTFGQAFFLYLLAEIFILITPLYIRFSIDQSVTSANLKLLLFISFAFIGFSLINAFIEYLKNRAFLRINLQLGWDMTVRVFSHMTKLPMLWFDRRILADILTRYDSLDQIKSVISNGAITAVLNGFFMVTLFMVMNWLSSELAVIVFFGVFLSALIKILVVKKTLRLSSEMLLSSIKEKTRRIETIKGIQSIKALCGESKFESEWLNTYADTVIDKERFGVFNIGVGTINKAIESIFLVIVIYYGVIGVISALTSVGTIFAFISYRLLFINRFNSLFDTIVQVMLLSLHTKRVADLVLEDIENDTSVTRSDFTPTGDITISNAGFTYSNYNEIIINNLNLSIKKGEFIGILGESGCGKSTLLKLLIGLYKINYGRIEYDGINADNIGYYNLRKHVGSYLQNDQSFVGSIADNISFYSDTRDDERIQEVLSCVEFNKEVQKLPMGINTDLGNMGGHFSAGQIQRILLARALYSNPKILLLDEATSNLNLELEERILSNIKELNITVIAVTHRNSIKNFADKVFRFENKNLKEIVD